MNKLFLIAALFLFACGPPQGIPVLSPGEDIAEFNNDCCTSASYNVCKLYEAIDSSETKKVCKHETIWNVPCSNVLREKKTGNLFCEDSGKLKRCFECD